MNCFSDRSERNLIAPLAGRPVHREAARLEVDAVAQARWRDGARFDAGLMPTGKEARRCRDLATLRKSCFHKQRGRRQAWRQKFKLS